MKSLRSYIELIGLLITLFVVGSYASYSTRVFMYVNSSKLLILTNLALSAVAAVTGTLFLIDKLRQLYNTDYDILSRMFDLSYYKLDGLECLDPISELSKIDYSDEKEVEFQIRSRKIAVNEMLEEIKEIRGEGDAETGE